MIVGRATEHHLLHVNAYIICLLLLTFRERELMKIFQEDKNDTTSANARPGKRLTKLLKHILKNYDRKIRPFYGGRRIMMSYFTSCFTPIIYPLREVAAQHVSS